MKTSALRNLLCCVLALLIWTNAFAQLGLGPRRLVDAQAPTLEEPDHLDIGLTKPGYVGSVGGVAFDKIASPVSNLTFRNLSLDYDPNRDDGKRLWVIVDGKRFLAPIYDWQLIPISKFADSRYYACVTLYGRLDKEEEEERELNNRSRIINYHPAFINTLLGLRLFQLDVLIWEPNAIDLPKNGDTYILGAGESEPNINANKLGLKEYNTYEAGLKGYNISRNRLVSNMLSPSNSYVICDQGRDIRFDFKDGTLTITGEPFFYFWHRKYFEPSYNQETVRNSVSDMIKILLDSGRLENPRTFQEIEWYIALLIKLNRQFAEEYWRSWFDENILKDKPLKVFLAQHNISWLRDQMIKLFTAWISNSVVHLKEYSKRVSEKPELLRAINPVVWNAGVNVMRYAAFLRYCKKSYPIQWRKFIGQIHRARIPNPQIKTPSIFRE